MNQLIDYNIRSNELVPVVCKKPGGRFFKGQIPWNKGMKGLKLGNAETHFKPGTLPEKSKPIGSTRTNAYGYIEVKVSELPSKWKNLHVAMWEDIVGPIPDGMFLRCKSDDITNTLPSNWELVDRSEHMRRNYNRKKASQSMCELYRRERVRQSIGLKPLSKFKQFNNKAS
jgi:hypothetical protein